MELSTIGFDISKLQDGFARGFWTPEDVVREVYRRIDALGENHAWTELVSSEDALAAARRLRARHDGAALPPLYGIPFSVKDNIDVAGLRTTCGCEGFDRLPEVSATSVRKALDAGAILIGKNTLDQFATGLNGTRTMGGHCRNVFDPRYVSGGSSSGSGVAVASGVVSFALGTDTGGSGRIPAAMNSIVGVKPTLGLVSGTGLVYNNRYFDCVPVFARTVEDGYRVLEVIRGYDETDAFSREDADAIALAPEPIDRFTFGIPSHEHLRFFGDELAREAWHLALEAMEAIGGTPVRIDFSIFVEAGRLPFDSGLLAERAVSYGEVVGRRPETVHPAVAAMIRKALAYTGTESFDAVYRMMALRRHVKTLFRGIDVLVTPTVGRAYTCEEVQADPIGANNNIGYYTYPVSPLDLCALAVPAAMRADGLPFGVSLVGLPGRDRVLRALGARFQARVGLLPGIEQRVRVMADSMP